MKPKQGINQGIEQTSTIGPLQVQLGKMVEMSGPEILDYVNKELEANPALEKREDEDENSLNKTEDGELYKEGSDEMIRNDYGDEDQIPVYNASNRSGDDVYYEPLAVAEVSLSDFLMSQIRERDITEKDEHIAEYIIGNLEDNGYLTRSPQAIADDITFKDGIEVDTQQVNRVLQMVRELDPPGIAARDLRDCILLQLSRFDDTPSRRLAYEIVDKCFDEFSKNHYDKVCAALGISIEQLKEAKELIKKTNPKPDSSYAGSSGEMRIQQISPDFEIELDDSDLEHPVMRLTLPNNIPELQISESYTTAYDLTKKGVKSPQSAIIKKDYVRARTFIDLLKNRQEKLMLTMKAIMKYQSAFMLTGDESQLRPMGLKHIAEATGFDLSTISRVTSSKYVSTPWGSYPLKFFFSEGLMTEGGEEVSTRKICSLLKELVEGEDKRRPLSDEKLCAKLRERGYDVARRTIAKYRENMKIPVARLRKQMS